MVCSPQFVGVVPSVSTMHLQSTTMAASDIGDYFTIGTQVKIITIYHKEYKGEIVAFDHKTKTLMISILWKSQSPLNSAQRHPEQMTWGLCSVRNRL